MYLDDLHDSFRLPNLFWSKVNKTDTCWLWTRARHEQGYGLLKVRIKGKYYKVRAHRISYLLAHGYLPDELHILHSCDVPACVRPDHLSLGDAFDNMQDKVSKGRQSGGQRAGGENTRAVMDEYAVIECRTRYQEHHISQRALAAAYGVSRWTIRDALAGRTWKHVP